jgi:hypothetical protein
MGRNGFGALAVGRVTAPSAASFAKTASATGFCERPEFGHGFASISCDQRKALANLPQTGPQSDLELRGPTTWRGFGHAEHIAEAPEVASTAPRSERRGVEWPGGVKRPA